MGDEKQFKAIALVNLCSLKDHANMKTINMKEYSDKKTSFKTCR